MAPVPSSSRQTRKQRSSARKSKESRGNNLGRFEVVDNWCQMDFSGWEKPYKPDPANSKGWEHQDHVDRLRDLVPFWRDGVLAAEAGQEVTKMEEFYRRFDNEEANTTPSWGETGQRGWESNWANDNMDGQAWGEVINDGWGEAVNDGWGEVAHDGWGTPAVHPASPWGAASPRRSRASSAKPVSQPRSNNTAMSSDRIAKSRPPPNPNQHGAADEGPLDVSSFVEKMALEDNASPERKQLLHRFYAMPTHEKLKKIQETVQFLRSHG
ncbi:unnamed protein product [Somion occarium]|uniref:Uncharacterized protein n=1 Tax=Somion occarium TaxID=3059160 RepID=A0ABP1CLR4_9APHY